MSDNDNDIYDEPRNPEPQPIWPWVVGLAVVGGIGAGIWYGVRKAKAAAKQVGSKIFTGGVGEDCPILQWAFSSDSMREDIADHQFSIWVLREGQEPKMVSTAPITPAQARIEIPRQMQNFVRDSRCTYAFEGDDPTQIVAGQDAEGEYVPTVT